MKITFENINPVEDIDRLHLCENIFSPLEIDLGLNTIYLRLFLEFAHISRLPTANEDAEGALSRFLSINKNSLKTKLQSCFEKIEFLAQTGYANRLEVSKHLKSSVERRCVLSPEKYDLKIWDWVRWGQVLYKDAVSMEERICIASFFQFDKALDEIRKTLGIIYQLPFNVAPAIDQNFYNVINCLTSLHSCMGAMSDVNSDRPITQEAANLIKLMGSKGGKQKFENKYAFLKEKVRQLYLEYLEDKTLYKGVTDFDRKTAKALDGEVVKETITAWRKEIEKEL